MYIKTFNQVSKEDVKEVGGKGASLGEMTKIGISVPSGFVITTRTFREFKNQEIPVDIKEEIFTAYDNLGVGRVAVRSSAVAEDSSNASWAGQLETYLNVDKDNLIENIRNCWNSMNSERALSYAEDKDIQDEDLAVAVVVQKMVESEVAGVMFTANPVTNNRDELMIEAGFGLGEMLVQGTITPDNFVVEKQKLDIKSKDIQSQDMMMVFENGENKEIEVPSDIKDTQTITDAQVIELAKIGLQIEKHYGFPQDIEWALEKGTFYIVQSRPITTLV